MCQPPAEKIAMAVLKAIGKEDAAAVRRVRPVYTSKPHRVYEALLSDGSTLELVMPPSPMLRLLRSERRIANSEAIVVQWLTAVLSQQRCSRESSPLPGSTRQTDSQHSPPPDPSERITGRSSSTADQPSSAETAIPDDEFSLLDLLPKLIEFSLHSDELGAPHSIFHARGGTTITSLPRALTNHERVAIDLQLGHLSRRISEVKSPTGRFGPAASLLDLATRSLTPNKDGSRTMSLSPKTPREGCKTWSAAFNLMIEGVLRDAEDMAVMLAYPIIRKHLTRLSYVLDEVDTPSLVFIDGMDDDNVMVTVSTAADGKGKEKDAAQSDSSHSSEQSGNEEQETNKQKSPNSDNETRLHVQRSPSPTSGPQVRVVGLRDWSNGLFGDPLLATAFSNDPSKELLDGYHGTTTPSADEDNASKSTRLLLYQAYHATVAIVTEFYRRRGQDTTRELAARRRLTEALAKLEEVADEPKGARHRRPSGEMSPAKKLKADENENERSPSSRRREATSPEG